MENSIINLDDYTYKTKTDGEYINIEDIEPDETKRRLNYPHVTHQKKTILEYEVDGKKYNKVIITNKLKGKKSVLNRYKNWKPFGEAIKNSTGMTTYNAPIILDLNCKSYSNSKVKDNEDRTENIIISNNRKKSATFSLSSYKPKTSILESLPKSIKKPGYAPPNVKSTSNSSCSILVRNIPTDLSKEEAEQELYNIFSKYGKVKKINILIQKNSRNIKDIGFIDMFDDTSMNNILNASEKFSIDASILSVERSNK